MGRADDAKSAGYQSPLFKRGQCRLQHDAVELSSLTWQEAERRLRDRPIGLLPVGAIEAHGPHLPLDTDVIIAREMARRGAELLVRQGLPVLLLPSVEYGVSFVGTSFKGTSPVDAQYVEAYLSSLLHHMAQQGYRALCVCNAHLEPAHVTAIQQAARSASDLSGVPIAAPDKREPRWSVRLSEEFRMGARHAGSYETSLLLAVAPDTVRWEIACSLNPVWIDLPARLRDGAQTFADAGSDLAYFGDPAAASAAEGERLFDALATIIRDAVLKILDLNERDA
jgi:creatinine amidohydrolase